jgi:hypothetical protein
MRMPPVHLRHDHRPNIDLTARSTCGTVAWTWTDDPQAVTCPKCIAYMELQPA